MHSTPLCASSASGSCSGTAAAAAAMAESAAAMAELAMSAPAVSADRKPDSNFSTAPSPSLTCADRG